MSDSWKFAGNWTRVHIKWRTVKKQLKYHSFRIPLIVKSESQLLNTTFIMSCLEELQERSPFWDNLTKTILRTLPSVTRTMTGMVCHDGLWSGETKMFWSCIQSACLPTKGDHKKFKASDALSEHLIQYGSGSLMHWGPCGIVNSAKYQDIAAQPLTASARPFRLGQTYFQINTGSRMRDPGLLFVVTNY